MSHTRISFSSPLPHNLSPSPFISTIQTLFLFNHIQNPLLILSNSTPRKKTKQKIRKSNPYENHYPIPSLSTTLQNQKNSKKIFK